MSDTGSGNKCELTTLAKDEYINNFGMMYTETNMADVFFSTNKDTIKFGNFTQGVTIVLAAKEIDTPTTTVIYGFVGK